MWHRINNGGFLSDDFHGSESSRKFGAAGQVGDEGVHNLGQDPRLGCWWAGAGMVLDTKRKAYTGSLSITLPVPQIVIVMPLVKSALPPFQTLTKSFAQATKIATRPTSKRRQEEWMEEDNLLGEEQDLRRQLQRGGGRGPGAADGGGRGRRLDHYGGRDQFQEGHERFGANRAYNPGRNDFGRNYPQQGGWNDTHQGARNHNNQGNWAPNHQQAGGNRPDHRLNDPWRRWSRPIDRYEIFQPC
ncbi:unnamed protein product [Miscanthus lutarioriparius]|uniref:Uncharacterized protein n=1 Tax=Miscanthus lutarioriparius TaxID=422564 RepID=A0A811RU45_9POAL|nr:unnamed protein product [Miscanthus lutarioriparius]